MLYFVQFFCGCNIIFKIIEGHIEIFNFKTPKTFLKFQNPHKKFHLVKNYCSPLNIHHFGKKKNIIEKFMQNNFHTFLKLNEIH